MKQKFLVCFILLTTLSCYAQDIHFSQFYMAPLHLNPAMTGVTDGQQRLTLNYRNQWASALQDKAFNTYSAAYDSKIAVGRYDYIGIGGTLWTDKSGALNFHNTQIHTSLSYSRRMGGNRKTSHYLIVGGDFGVSQRGVNLEQATWGSQNNGGQLDVTRPTLESGIYESDKNSIMNIDVSGGLLWYSNFSDKNNFYIGTSLQHINRPNISFNVGTYVPLHSKLTIHTGGEINLGKKFGLLPGLVYFRQNNLSTLNLGTSIKMKLSKNRRDNDNIQFGIWSRFADRLPNSILTDALIFSTRIDYDTWSMGISYDVNISTLQTTTQSSGGFELAFVYRILRNDKRNIYCPKF